MRSSSSSEEVCPSCPARAAPLVLTAHQGACSQHWPYRFTAVLSQERHPLVSVFHGSPRAVSKPETAPAIESGAGHLALPPSTCADSVTTYRALQSATLCTRA